jgi:hypothetical protein
MPAPHLCDEEEAAKDGDGPHGALVMARVAIDPAVVIIVAVAQLAPVLPERKQTVRQPFPHPNILAAHTARSGSRWGHAYMT